MLFALVFFCLKLISLFYFSSDKFSKGLLHSNWLTFHSYHQTWNRCFTLSVMSIPTPFSYVKSITNFSMNKIVFHGFPIGKKDFYVLAIILKGVSWTLKQLPVTYLQINYFPCFASVWNRFNWRSRQWSGFRFHFTIDEGSFHGSYSDGFNFHKPSIILIQFHQFQII